MAIWKYTMIFNSSTNVTGGSIGQRTGGWSESFYKNAAPSDVVANETWRDVFLRQCQRRAALLPTGFSVGGQRYQQVDPAGGSATGGVVYPGTAGIQADVPQMALFLRLSAQGVPNIKPLTLRGLPDARVVEGEYFPASNFSAALNTYVTNLSLWQFKGRDLQQTPLSIFTIDNLGVVTTDEAHSFVENDFVRVLRTIDENGRRQGGRFRVIAPVTSHTFKITPWDFGDCHGGKVRADVTIYPLIASQSANVLRVIVRKVGRPFGGYRGRASTRR